MKNNSMGRAKGVQLCSAAADPIIMNGQTWTPDAATAYAEILVSHGFPVYLDVPERGELPVKTAIHPQTVANSYRSLRAKVVNLAHIMRSYDPKKHARDRILGTVMDVEFPPPPEGGWKVQGDPELAPGIRVLVAFHKAAEGVPGLLDTWAKGKTPFGDTVWTVSMENDSFVDTGGFLVKAEGGIKNEELKTFAETTPEDFKALGWVYVPWAEAGEELRGCLETEGCLAIKADYLGCETFYLNGGLNGTIFYSGLAMTPLGKESKARVVRINASAMTPEELAVGACFGVVEEFLERFKQG